MKSLRYVTFGLFDLKVIDVILPDSTKHLARLRKSVVRKYTETVMTFAWSYIQRFKVGLNSPDLIKRFTAGP